MNTGDEFTGGITPLRPTPRFDASDGDYNLFVDASRLNSQIDSMKTDLTDHGGQLKSFSAVVSAVQSSLESWKTTVIALNAAFFAAIAILATVIIFSVERLDSRADDTESSIDALGTKIDALVTLASGPAPAVLAQETSATNAEKPPLR